MFSNMHKRSRNPCYSLKWIPTGRTFKQVGLIWIPTGKLLTYGKAMVDLETLKCSDMSVPDLHVDGQKCDVSAGTPNSTAVTSYSHHVKGLKVWRPKIYMIPECLFSRLGLPLLCKEQPVVATPLVSL